MIHINVNNEPFSCYCGCIRFEEVYEGLYECSDCGERYNIDLNGFKRISHNAICNKKEK